MLYLESPEVILQALTHQDSIRGEEVDDSLLCLRQTGVNRVKQILGDATESGMSQIKRDEDQGRIQDFPLKGGGGGGGGVGAKDYVRHAHHKRDA